MILKSISVHRNYFVKASVILTIFLLGAGVGTHVQRLNYSLDSKLLKEYQYNSTAGTFDHDTKHYGSQWVQNLTDLRHERTKFAVGILMKDEDFTRMHWMGDGRVKDTTIFFITDSIDLNSVQKLDGDMYGLSFQSNTTRDAGALTFNHFYLSVLFCLDDKPCMVYTTNTWWVTLLALA